MATTQPPKPANPARWRFLQATTLTGAALAGLFLIQLAAASRDLPPQATPPEPAPAKALPRTTATTRLAFSSRETKQGRGVNVAARVAPAATATHLPASRPTSAPATRPAPEPKFAKAEKAEREEREEVDEPEAQLASDRVPKAAVPATVPAAAPTSIPAPEGGELLHDIRPAPPAAPAKPPATVNPLKRPSRVLRLQVTAYCPCPRCCGSKAEGVTASGLPVTYDGGVFAAADTAILPFGTRLIIPGYAAGRPVEVIDRGGAIKGLHVDVFFPTHEQARAWGRRWVNATVVEHGT